MQTRQQFEFRASNEWAFHFTIFASIFSLPIHLRVFQRNVWMLDLRWFCCRHTHVHVFVSATTSARNEFVCCNLHFVFYRVNTIIQSIVLASTLLPCVFQRRLATHLNDWISRRDMCENCAQQSIMIRHWNLLSAWNRSWFVPSMPRMLLSELSRKVAMKNHDRNVKGHSQSNFLFSQFEFFNLHGVRGG